MHEDPPGVDQKMVTPCIENPYRELAAYALGKPHGHITVQDLREAEVRALRVTSMDPPLLGKFLEQYPPQDPMRKVLTIQIERAEGVLLCLWRGDYQAAFDIQPGPYIHFKGGEYLVFKEALLLEGPKERMAIVYYEPPNGRAFVRTIREWVDIVKWPDGLYRPRFMKKGSV